VGNRNVDSLAWTITLLHKKRIAIYPAAGMPTDRSCVEVFRFVSGSESAIRKGECQAHRRNAGLQSPGLIRTRPIPVNMESGSSGKRGIPEDAIFQQRRQQIRLLSPLRGWIFYLLSFCELTPAAMCCRRFATHNHATSKSASNDCRQRSRINVFSCDGAVIRRSGTRKTPLALNLPRCGGLIRGFV
jgi:hypothetical protein